MKFWRCRFLLLPTFLIIPALSPAAEVEFRGVIESLPRRINRGDWVVAGTTVSVSSETAIHAEKAPVAVGVLVEVKGDRRRDGTVRAKEITTIKDAPPTATGDWRVIAWNDLGMHCMDGKDYSIYSVLPPFNTFHAQVLDSNGDLVTGSSGIEVTYRAVADPDGSINATSEAKTTFWDFVDRLFGVSLPIDQGLAGFRMPGAGNTAQTMHFDGNFHWFTGEGVPITPYDDQGNKNYYPMVEITVRNAQGDLLASTQIVLPVSDELDCQACHASGSVSGAQPAGGWSFLADPERDYKINVIRRHDDGRLGDPGYQSILLSAGYDTAGLKATVDGGTPILCAKCHGSNALPGTGVAGVSPMTQAMHAYHAHVTDPDTGLRLEDEANRSSCYRCHPGSSTRCLRGAMGSAVASDGGLAMQCQSCHGSMSTVGDSARSGWLEEPGCESCHTGTATDNNGQIRFLSVFEPGGQPREAVNDTFAVNGGTLYRFSEGHGGLQCSACHGSPHAIYPSSHRNDNIQNFSLQGHKGTLSECSACHTSVPQTASGGPHGMHPLGQDWIGRHEGAAEGNASACRSCHGDDYRGTVLSRSLADRTVQTEFGTFHFWQGFQIGCYACHRGPNSESRNSNRPAQVQNTSLTTIADVSKSVTLQASDPEGAAITLRIVSQPANGTVALNGSQATYFPFVGFTGDDVFTFAAWDGQTDSNLGTVQVQVGP